MKNRVLKGIGVTGQLSFDLGFAIIMALIIFSSLITYWRTSEISIQDGRALTGLNMIADYTVGNLNALRNSIGSSTVTYSLDLLDEYLFTAPGQTGSRYNLSYQVTFNQQQVTFTDANNPSRAVVRYLGFDINCQTGALGTYKTGDVITLKECHLSGGNINCGECTP